MNKNNQTPGDNLLNQIVNITKAHAYDILANHVGELKEENEKLREALEGAREVMLHFKESPDWSEEHDDAYIKLREALS